MLNTTKLHHIHSQRPQRTTPQRNLQKSTMPTRKQTQSPQPTHQRQVTHLTTISQPQPRQRLQLRLQQLPHTSTTNRNQQPNPHQHHNRPNSQLNTLQRTLRQTLRKPSNTRHQKLYHQRHTQLHQPRQKQTTTSPQRNQQRHTIRPLSHTSNTTTTTHLPIQIRKLPKQRTYTNQRTSPRPYLQKRQPFLHTSSQTKNNHPQVNKKLDESQTNTTHPPTTQIDNTTQQSPYHPQSQTQNSPAHQDQEQ